MNKPRDLVDEIDEMDGSDYGDPNESFDDDSDDYGDDDGSDDGSDNDPPSRGVSLESEEFVDDEDLTRMPKKKGKKAETPAQQQRQTKKTNDPKKEKGEIRLLSNGMHVDAQGNVVDPRDGTIIARAGSERRWYEKHARAESQVQQVSKEVETLRTQLQTQEWLNGVPQRFGLNHEDVQNALALAAVYKQNPVEAARELVEMALATGANVTDILGKDAGNALEMGAVKQMIEERLSPLINSHKQTEEQTNRRTQAEAKMKQFIDDHEYSELHLPVLDRMMGDNPDLSPEKAYYELKLFCARNDFDFSIPLQPQLQARKQQQQRGERPTREQQPAPRRGLPNGRTANMSQREVGDTMQAEPSTSWADIIKSSM